MEVPAINNILNRQNHKGRKSFAAAGLFLPFSVPILQASLKYSLKPQSSGQRSAIFRPHAPGGCFL